MTKHPNRWFFKAYSKSQGRILEPHEVALAGVWMGFNGHLEWHPDLILLHFTGFIDVAGTALFEQDIVEFEAPNEFGSMSKCTGILKWFENPGHYSIAISDGNPGDQFPTNNVRKVGNALVEKSI